MRQTCPVICRNIPAAPVYGVYILIGYSSDRGSNHDFLERRLVLKRKLPMLPIVKLKSSLRKFYGRFMTVNRYGVSVSQMTTDMFRLSQAQSCLIIIQRFTIGFLTGINGEANSGVETAYPFGVHDSPHFLLRITDADCPFKIFKLFIRLHYLTRILLFL